jgi:hypothetical protein
LIIGLPLSEAAGAAGRQVNSQPDFSQIFLGDDFLENDGARQILGFFYFHVFLYFLMR